MKNLFLLSLVAIGLTFSQCAPDTTPSPTFDYDKADIELMQELAPQVVGTWTMKQVHINIRKNYSARIQLHLKSDTVYRDLATLVIKPASKARFIPRQPRYPEFEGTISFRGKSYPVYFYLIANAERVYSSKGPHAFFLFSFNFPDGTRVPEAEETFLQELGLIDNYSITMMNREPSMIWEGLNRGIDQIIFQKQ